MRKRARIDANQSSVVNALRAEGVSVLSLAPMGGGVPDLLCSRRNRTWLVEIKNGALVHSKQKLTPMEFEFHSSWQGELWLVNSVDQAMELLRSHRDADATFASFSRTLVRSIPRKVIACNKT
jgi:hypothetical protein